jgi:hypothetical protein
MTSSGQMGTHSKTSAEMGLSTFSPSRWSAALFLIALIVLLCLSPVLNDLAQGSLMEALLMTLVLISAVPAVGGRRRTVLIAGLLAVPAVAGKWLHHLRPEQFPSALFLSAAIAFGMFVIAHHLGFILRTVEVDTQVLCAGVSTFLMLGLLWMFAYLLLASVDPGAFVMELEPGTSQPLSGFGALYFSFDTLAGAGLGEVKPTSNAARMLVLLEAMTAMFYIAILIARLVALYSERAASQRKDHDASPAERLR